MTDPDVKNLRKMVTRARKRAEQKTQQALREYYRTVQFGAFTSVRAEQPNPREPIGRLARLVERWAKK